MTLILENHRQELRRQLERLVDPVRLLVFTEKTGCQFCTQTRQLVEEVAALSERITFEVHDVEADREIAIQYGADKTPAIVILRGVGQWDTGIRFFGIPSGYEFSTLVDDIIAVSRNEPALADATQAWLAGLDRPIHLQVFVTPT